nr:hypothetical protein [Planosporangium thailandense]
MVAGVALGLVGVAVGIGWLCNRWHVPIRANAAPLFADWLPHVGPGTPVAVAVAVLAVAYGPQMAARSRWPSLLITAYLTAVAWTFSLALVDGWQRGLAGRLTTRPEYLHEVPRVTDIPATLRAFTGRILDFQPDSWTTHTSGHPPGALLVFVWLDRIGLGGGGWAAIVCVLLGATAAVTVPVTVRALCGEEAARACVPFLALFPGAVWMGVSADAVFTAVVAAGLALLVAPRLALFGGALLGFAMYLSYGLVLVALLALVAVGSVRRLAWGVAGAAAVVVAFTAAGFRWLDGYHLVVIRYYQGIAAQRPYAYWVWADLACLVLCAGPAAAPTLRRALTAPWPNRLPVTALLAIVAADLSGLSKAEVERIWLPYAVWLLAGAHLLPASTRRWWLAAQAATALAVNHLVLTNW